MNDDKYALEEFELYRIAREYRRRVYQIIRQLPAEERFELARQMRRAAVSVTNNIAEGHGRWHYKEFIRYCRIARGSVEELIDDFNVCEDEQYANAELIHELKAESYKLIHRINSYVGYLKRIKQGIV